MGDLSEVVEYLLSDSANAIYQSMGSIKSEILLKLTEEDFKNPCLVTQLNELFKVCEDEMKNVNNSSIRRDRAYYRYCALADFLKSYNLLNE